MSDRFKGLDIRFLWELMEDEYSRQGSYFGIGRGLFFIPKPDDLFRMYRYDKLLETPVGVAAGPHSQMAQNIVSAWLCGARYIELKTVQTLDELDVSKPCIDMEDEGYNCEWSQELCLDESFDEYLKAWVLIYALRRKLGFKDESPGFIFNMSVGYNLDGILKDNVQKFFARMENAERELEEKIAELEAVYPSVRKIGIPSKLSDNITLSTMHGCPPDEIEQIAKYLIEEKGLHTTIKLNPTLIGAKTLRMILNEKLGYDTVVPDLAFDHDLKFKDGVEIIRSLSDCAKRRGVHFSVKLTNTLECENNRDIFSSDEKMMYMSGRALHPVAVNLALKLQEEFDGKLDISFAGGADCFNIAEVIGAGLKPVTVSSDILKPGGYTRLTQYLDELNQAMGGKTLDLFLTNAFENLERYARKTIDDNYYRKSFYPNKSIKTSRDLTMFDCIKAPCIETCPSNQDVTDYMYYASKGDFNRAFEVILATNPFPSVTGMVCDHLCTSKCTRQNYDSPLAIREIKRFVAENADEPIPKPRPKNGLKVAIIGAGPSGLSCGYYLAMGGASVTVYEEKSQAGGMVRFAIPPFRLSDEALEKDLSRIRLAGVVIRYDTKIDGEIFSKILEENQYVYVAVGASQSKSMGIDGENIDGVTDFLTILSQVNAGQYPDIGKRVAVIGGGNSAMDCARTAKRLTGKDGQVTVVYRRTIAQMPADLDEIIDAIDEGVRILELTAPVEVKKTDDGIELVCEKMELGDKDSSGRRRPVRIEGSQFSLTFDTVIRSIGQDVVLDFMDMENFPRDKVFIGGDAKRGAANIISAIADGKNAALEILGSLELPSDIPYPKREKLLKLPEYRKKSACRVFGVDLKETPLDKRDGFDVVTRSFSKEEAIEESSRCLLCDDICNVCVTVCPNRANISYVIDGISFKMPNGKIFEVKQEYQTANIADFCNECGNCETFCPTNGKPYADKPKICLSNEIFETEERAFIIDGINGVSRIRYKENDKISVMVIDDGYYIYDSDEFYAKVERNDFKVKELKFKQGTPKNFNPENCARMCVLLETFKNTALEIKDV